MTIVAVVCLMLCPAAANAKQTDGQPTVTLPDFTTLIKQLKPVTVNISSTKTVKPRMRQFGGSPFGNNGGRSDPFHDFFGDDFFKRFFGDQFDREYKRKGLGSGFIIDAEGYVITNNHVVEGADEIIVKTHNEKEYEAEIVGTDPKTDIALIKIKNLKEDLPVATLGDSDKLQVGEWVLAIGNPFGLQETVTAGIVSAKWRKIGAGPYENFIQTDASINPGNSGGPLFNTQGDVVGVNTLIYSPSGGNIGIGFAIPINLAKDIVAQLKEKGKVVRGWLGVVVQKVTPELAESFNMKKPKGALIADVEPGGPADEAGIRSGDIIISFDGKDVEEMADLPMMVAQTPVGEKVTVSVLRDGDKKDFTVKIGELQEKQYSAMAETDTEDLGIKVREITPELARQYELPEESGVIVTDVQFGSPAAEAGLRKGDIIKEVNRDEITSISEFRAAIKKSKKENILFLIKRGGNSLWIVVKPES
jgi:serine protease Do